MPWGLEPRPLVGMFRGRLWMGPPRYWEWPGYISEIESKCGEQKLEEAGVDQSHG
jgi:hypothetical protein